MNVFELAGQFRQLQSLIEAGAENEALDAELASVEGSFDQKLENMAFIIRNNEAAIAGLQTAMAALQARIDAATRENERVQHTMLRLMAATGKDKVAGRFLVVKRKINPISVRVIDEAVVPREYLRHVPEKVTPQSWEVDKKKIAADAKEGVIVEGVEIVRTEKVVIA